MCALRERVTEREPEDEMAKTKTVCQSVAPSDQSERLRKAAPALAGLRDLVQGLGPLSPGPDRDDFCVALREFLIAISAVLSASKRPRKPRRERSSITAGWVGGG
jgi:hypothetical protein